jgi:hypothetical protein
MILIKGRLLLLFQQRGTLHTVRRGRNGRRRAGWRDAGPG